MEQVRPNPGPSPLEMLQSQPKTSCNLRFLKQFSPTRVPANEPKPIQMPAEPTSHVIHRYQYPDQEMEIRAKDELKTRDGKTAASLIEYVRSDILTS